MAVMMAQGHCESSLSSFNECRLSAGWPLARRPHVSRTVSKLLHCTLPDTKHLPITDEVRSAVARHITLHDSA